MEFDGGKLSGESPIALAVAAAFSRCYSWLHKPAEVPPQRGTKEYEQMINRKLFERAQRDVQQAKQQKEYALGNFGIDMGGDSFGVDDSGGFGWPDDF